MNTNNTIGEEILNEIRAYPNNFRVLRRLPYSTDTDTPFPQQIAELVGDEINIIILDSETTGLDCENDEMIELGLLGITYSPSKEQISTIYGCASFFEQPSIPIPEVITKITGIKDADVLGHRFNDTQVESIFQNCSLVIAHNAKFDRGFFDKRFPQLSNLRWACSIKEVDWCSYNLEGNKLLVLLFQLGYFYEAHRADIDCIATLRLFQDVQRALPELIASSKKTSVKIKCHTAPYHVKDTLKERGYIWDDSNPNAKHWYTTVDQKDLGEEVSWLKILCPTKHQNFTHEFITAENRYKS